MTTNYTSVEQAIADLGSERVLRYINATAKQRAYNSDRGKENREILKAYRSGEISFGGTRVDMTVKPAEQD